MAETTGDPADRPGPAPGRARRLAVISAALLAAATLCCGAVTAPATSAASIATVPASRHAGVVGRGEGSPAFEPIHELWDGDRVARRRDAVVACRHDVSTLAIVTCDEDRTENLDVEIDVIRDRAFRSAPTAADKEAINRDDDSWLANRIPVCRAGYPAKGGGTIVQVLAASCETAVSSSRLDEVEGRPVPTSELVATDDVDPDATQYATTASGTRIGAIDTQGDQTGGVVIAWVVIAGYQGFVVRPADFTYVHGSFVDAGVVYGHPAGHRVAAGTKYVFGVDYSRMSDDPDAAAGRGRFEYRSGTDLVGAWK